MSETACVCGHEPDEHFSGHRGPNTGYCLTCNKIEGRACGMFRKHALCPGSGKWMARTEGGASWMNYTRCPECGRKVWIKKNSKLRSHRA